MDRPKTGTGRGSKSKTPQFPDDLYILGPKGTRIESNEAKRPVPVPVKPGPSNPLIGKISRVILPFRSFWTFTIHLDLDRRRIATSSVAATIPSNVPPAKKAKPAAGVLPRTNPFLPPNAVPESTKSWEQGTIEVDSIDLVPTVVEAKENEEYEKVVSICVANENLCFSD